MADDTQSDSALPQRAANHAPITDKKEEHSFLAILMDVIALFTSGNPKEKIAERLTSKGLPSEASSAIGDVMQQIASGHKDSQTWQKDMSTLDRSINQMRVATEVKIVEANLKSNHEPPSAEEQAKIIKHLESLPKGFTQEQQEAFKDALLQSKGMAPANQEKFEKDLQALGGNQAVAAYRELAQLKSGNAAADPEKLGHATEALRMAFADTPLAIGTEHHNDSGLVSPPALSAANVSKGKNSSPQV